MSLALDLGEQSEMDGIGLSNAIGYNDFHYYGNKTFNATLPGSEAATKTRFDDGGFDFLQNTANLDVSKRFSSVAQGSLFFWR